MRNVHSVQLSIAGGTKLSIVIIFLGNVRKKNASGKIYNAARQVDR